MGWTLGKTPNWGMPTATTRKKKKWSLHSFLTTAPQQADVAGNILLFFYKKKTKENKKIIKYYQPRQLVVGLLWETSVGIISQKKNKRNIQAKLTDTTCDMCIW